MQYSDSDRKRNIKQYSENISLQLQSSYLETRKKTIRPSFGNSFKLIQKKNRVINIESKPFKKQLINEAVAKFHINPKETIKIHKKINKNCEKVVKEIYQKIPNLSGKKFENKIDNTADIDYDNFFENQFILFDSQSDRYNCQFQRNESLENNENVDDDQTLFINSKLTKIQKYANEKISTLKKKIYLQREEIKSNRKFYQVFFL